MLLRKLNLLTTLWFWLFANKFSWLYRDLKVVCFVLQYNPLKKKPTSKSFEVLMSKKLSFDVNVDCIIVSAFLLVFTHWIFSHIWKVTLIIIPTSTIQHLNKVFLISIIVRVWGIPVCVIHFFSTFTPNKIHLLCFISSAGPSCITPVTIASVCTIRMKYSDNYHC